jgi:hypothetical protein
MNHKKGQILFMFVFSVLVIFGFLTLAINISKLSIARLKLQKAADSAALALATYQARCFNAVADKNFILKYPSGDKEKVYISPTQGYSFPGIHQVDMSTGFIFISEAEYLGDEKNPGFLQIIDPHIEQQDNFINIYEKLLPRIVDDYVKKNDTNATINEYRSSKFSFKRETVDIKYRDLRSGSGNTIVMKKDVPAWMTDSSNYTYSIVKLKKVYKIWNMVFNMQAIALGEVVKNRGQIWEEPKPEYMAKLAITQEDGVLH